MSSRVSWPLVVAALAVFFALVGGYIFGHHIATNTLENLYSTVGPIRQNDAADPLVSPLLGYRVPEATSLGQYQSLKDAMQTEVTAATNSGKATRVSVYFRDLDTARWIGINQAFNYYPASLLKVPVMMAYYKKAEEDSSILSDEIVYPGVTGEDAFDAPSNLVVGQTYSVEQLIEHMIIDSDNGATFTLLAHFDPTALAQVYTDLGIPEPGDNSAAYQISNRTYALFFRILYNATYLSPHYSQKALELLSKTTFNAGLVAGVPLGTQVAHKFGEHVLSSDGKDPSGVELHDCGVTYFPGHPYLLCVMTSAKDILSATDIIQNISSTAYASVSAEYAATSTPSK